MALVFAINFGICQNPMEMAETIEKATFFAYAGNATT
jgi:hypothetical protein